MAIRILYGLILTVIISTLATLGILHEIGLKDLGTSFLALSGTFIGATFAFRLNEDKEKQKKLAEQRGSLNRVLFVLLRQRNAICQIKKDFDKYPSQFEKAFNLPAIKPPSYSDLTHSFIDLEFLLDTNTPEDADLLLHLSIEQERFHQAMESIRTRNEFYVQEVQPAIEKNAMNGKSVDLLQAKQMLGERIFGGAMLGASVATEHVDASNQSLPEMHKTVLQRAKSLFPGKKFIQYHEHEHEHEHEQ